VLESHALKYFKDQAAFAARQEALGTMSITKEIKVRRQSGTQESSAMGPSARNNTAVWKANFPHA
jgi:hypothetical protein